MQLKPVAVAMGIIAAASIDLGSRRDLPTSTPGPRMKHRRHGCNPLSAPSAVAASPMEASGARVCQK